MWVDNINIDPEKYGIWDSQSGVDEGFSPVGCAAVLSGYEVLQEF
jgi:hypothetical protein